MMQIRLEKRLEPSKTMLYLTPIAAVLVTALVGALVFSLIGYDGIGAVREIFLTPLLNPLKWQDLAVKSAPLIIIAVGLSIGYRANVWNIGAEGQYVLGGLAATGVALLTRDMSGPWILPLMIAAGIAGGMAWAVVPAFLRTRLQVNEILTSLMLTYVAIQLLNYLVIGPWKDPMGFGFPQTRMFTSDQMLPNIIPRTIVHLGVPIAIVVALAAWFFMSRSVFGYQIKVVGAAPDAARYGGFSVNKTIWLALLTSGALAGLAGVLEAAGPFGRMVPSFPTNYGHHRRLSRAVASGGHHLCRPRHGGCGGGRGGGADHNQAAGGRRGHFPVDDAVLPLGQRRAGALSAALRRDP